jgi:hypothetical protein
MHVLFAVVYRINGVPGMNVNPYDQAPFGFDAREKSVTTL